MSRAPVQQDGGRRFARRVAVALAVALAAIVLVEAALRILPPPPFVPPAPLRGRIAHLTRSELVTVDYETRTPPFSLLPLPGTTRIVCCGSSSTYGLGLTPQCAWPWRMDAGMPDDSAVEVVNLARVGATSSDQVHIVREALALRPTCIVLMEGNNEFLPIMAARAANLPLDAGRERLLLALARHSRIAGWMRVAALQPPAASAPDVPDPPGLDKITVSDDDMALARDTYRENLRDIARMCASARVRLVLCTVPVNIGWPPAVDDAPPEAARIRAALDRGQPDEALALLEKTPSAASATLLWLEGRARAAAHQGQTGFPPALRAVELDRHPLRARPDFNEVVRQVAAEYQVPCCDLAGSSALLEPGMYLDGCHFNALGATTVATRIAEALRHEGLAAPFTPYRSSPHRWVDLTAFCDLPTFLAEHGAALPPAFLGAARDCYARHSTVSFGLADCLPRLAPTDAHSLPLLALYGHTFTTAHKYRQAAEYYKAATALDPAASADLGWALYFDGKPAQAMDAWPARPADRVTSRARAVLDAAR